MESFFVSLNVIAPLFLLMALGYTLRSTRLLPEQLISPVNKLIFKVFLPVLLFMNIYTTDLGESFDSTLLLFALSCVLIEFLFALALVLPSEKAKERRGVMLQGMFRSNFVIFGIPVIQSLYGKDASGAATVLIAAVVPLFNVLAVIALELFRKQKIRVFSLLKGIFTNPLIIASALGIAFVLLKIQLPNFLTSALGSAGGIATPLAFVTLGASFHFQDISGYKKDLFLTLGVKLLFFPLLFLGMALLFGFRGVALAVLMTAFASPVAVSSFPMAQQMGGDSKLASQLVVYSSALSIFTMFLLIFLFKSFAWI